MRLQTKLLLIMIISFVLTFSILEWLDYHNIKKEMINNIRYEARHIRGVLMATRRVYHHQFLDSGIPLTDKTIGFLPAHSMSLISKDFRNWTADKLYFNNVSDRPRNLRNTADSIENEAIDYFRSNPTEKERFTPFKSIEGEAFYHYSTPIWIEDYCLKCHGKKEASPETIRNSYDTSYNYEAGELRGVMSIKLPATQLNKLVRANFLQDLWVHLASFTGVFLLIAFLQYRYVTVPLSRITKGMSSFGENEQYQKIDGLSGEMAVVGKTFNKMSERLIERTADIVKLSEAIKHSSVTIVITDIEGNIEYVNPRFVQLTGYSIEEAIGKNPRIMKSGETPSEVYEELWSTIKSGNEWSGEICNKKKNGEKYLEHVSISPVKDDKGIIANFIAVKEDITEHRKMEEALLQSEKLKSIGTITAGISHEFNNILAIISGNVQLLEGAYKDDSALTAALLTIMKAADDGAQITSNMLKFTKTSQDATALVSSDIIDLIRQSIDFTKPRWANEAQTKGIDYNVDIEDMKKVPSIICKPSEIREIFINIIHNALDAMPEGGCISFSTRSDDDTVFIKITDNGEGMSQKVQSNIFDPFFSTKGVDGTGLGMSIVYGIVTRHGGKITVSSEIGNGTSFTLQFPITNKRRSPIEVPNTEQETNVKCLRVLVIDDEEAIRDILNQFLSRDGHNVKLVDNGADAINMIECEKFDLVLCDLAMPKVFGYDVIKALHGLKKRPKIGVVTGWNEEHVSHKDMKVDFWLRKPFKRLELSKHINELFAEDSK